MTVFLSESKHWEQIINIKIDFITNLLIFAATLSHVTSNF